MVWQDSSEDYSACRWKSLVSLEFQGMKEDKVLGFARNRWNFKVSDTSKIAQEKWQTLGEEAFMWFLPFLCDGREPILGSGSLSKLSITKLHT